MQTKAPPSGWELGDAGASRLTGLTGVLGLQWIALAVAAAAVGVLDPQLRLQLAGVHGLPGTHASGEGGQTTSEAGREHTVGWRTRGWWHAGERDEKEGGRARGWGDEVVEFAGRPRDAERNRMKRCEAERD